MAIIEYRNNCGVYALGFDGSDLNSTQYTGVIVGPAPEGMPGTEGAALLKPNGTTPFFGILQSYGVQGEPIEVARSGLSPALISSSAAGGNIGQKLSVQSDGTFKEASGSSYDVVAMSIYEPGQQVTVDLGR